MNKAGDSHDLNKNEHPEAGDCDYGDVLSSVQASIKLIVRTVLVLWGYSVCVGGALALSLLLVHWV